MDVIISVQLWSIRDLPDWTESVRRLAAMGYQAVEPAGFPGTTPQRAARLFRSLGLSCPSLHTALPEGPDRARAFDDALALGARYLITGGPPGGEEAFRSRDTILKTADMYNDVAAAARARGLELGYHSHWWEMAAVDDQPGYRIFFERVDKRVIWQVDAYWAQVGGADPLAVLREAGERAKLIHVKDGPLERGKAEVAIGAGSVDTPAVLRAAAHAGVWVVELDECEGDILAALQASYVYLDSMRRQAGGAR